MVEKEKIIRSATHSPLPKNLGDVLDRWSACGSCGGNSLLVFTVRQAKRWLLLAVLMLAIAPNLSWGSSETDDLYELFQVDLPSADIVILFDASLSMKNHQYDDVKRAVIDFVPALTDKENLHLRIFGDAVSSPLEGKGSEVAGGIEGYLPQAPLFNHTDLGLAILKGLDFLEREGASQVQAFFLLTDGLHQPPSGSLYSRDFANDPNWQALQRRAQALCRQHRIFVYGFGLAQQTDIAVLRRVFPSPNVEVIVGNAAQVARALQQARERLRQTQLRQAIEQELIEGRVEISRAKNSLNEQTTDFEMPITVRNTDRHLPVCLEQVDVQRAGAASNEVECTLSGFPANAVLAPGKQLQAIVKGRLRAAPPSWRIGEAHLSYEATFQFVPVAKFQSQAALDELAARLSPPYIDSASLAVSLRIAYGLPYWVTGGLLLMIIAIAGVATVKVKRARRRSKEMKQHRAERRRLAGTLKIWHTRQGEPERVLP